LLGETLHAQEYIGILILLIGIVIAGAPHKLTSDKGMRYAYLFAFIGALNALTIKAASSLFSPAFIMFAMATPSVFILPLFMRNRKQQIGVLFNRNLYPKIGVSLLNAGSFYLYVIAQSFGPVSIVQSVYQSMMIISVLAGILILNERDDMMRKLSGTAITIAGILVMTLAK